MGWIVDVVVVLILIVSIAVSAKRGIVKCLYGAFGSVAAFILAAACAAPIAMFISTMFDIALFYLVVLVVAAIILFIIFRILIKKLANWLSNAIEKVAFINVVSKILGGLFGLIAAFLTVTVIILIVFLFVMENGIMPNETVYEFLRSGFLSNLILKVGMMDLANV